MEQLALLDTALSCEAALAAGAKEPVEAGSAGSSAGRSILGSEQFPSAGRSHERTGGDSVLPGERIHLWAASLQRFRDHPRARAACTLLLGAEERAHNARYRREEDRLRDLLARALVRTALSVYAPVPPAEWRFTRDAHGRPRATTPIGNLRDGRVGLHFSLSHGGDLVVCAIASSPAIGVDVERVDASAMMPDALHERERRDPGSFFSFWTLREAYGKALGIGLPGIAETEWFELVGEAGARLHRGGEVDESWWFERAAPAPDHVLAVAFAPSPGGTPRVVRHGMPPLPGW